MVLLEIRSPHFLPLKPGPPSSDIDCIQAAECREGPQMQNPPLIPKMRKSVDIDCIQVAGRRGELQMQNPPLIPKMRKSVEGTSWT